MITVDAQDQRAYNALKAQQSGEEHEKAVNAALNMLVEDGLAAWHKTGPETKTITAQRATTTRRHKSKTIIIGPGPADRIVGYGSRAIWLEIKSIKEVNFRTHRERLHQYETMMTFARFGFIGVYLLHWHKKDEWRFHPVVGLERRDDGGGEYGYGVMIYRSQGILVPQSVYGIPDLKPGLDTLCLEY